MVEYKLQPINSLHDSGENESPFSDYPGSPHTPCSSPEFYDRAEISTPTLLSNVSVPRLVGHPNSLLESFHSNEREKMPDSDHPSLTQRRSQGYSQKNSTQRSPQAPSPTSGLPPSSSSSTETVRGLSPANFQGSTMLYPPANVQYGQRPWFLGQYPSSAQTSPFPSAHGPSYYTYLPYHHPVVGDNNMSSQNMQPSYPAILQPHAATAFPYQRHPSDNTPSTHLPPFPIQLPTPIYPPPQMPVSPQGPSQIPATSVSNNVMTPSYAGSGQFHSSQYPSPIPHSPYSYSPHSFTPPIYQPQYRPHPSFQRFPSSSEAETQAFWYHLPRSPAPQSPPYESGAVFSTKPQEETEARVYGCDNLPSPNSAQEGQASIDSLPAVGSSSRTPNRIPVPAGSSSVVKPPDKPIVRRSYHPNAPPHRSEWVMWAGNVPSDATHDELWRFFNQKPAEPPAGSPEDTGVISIFLISRSNCAFVNYKNGLFLQEAVSRFNGTPLRSGDSRCPRLVCRVRRLDDDLTAGVGGQRGMGMHTKWIREQKGKHRAVDSSMETPDVPSSSSAASLSERMATVSMSGNEDEEEEKQRRQTHVKHSSSSGSYASTNSSFLVTHFPKRYFILKSLTQHDLDLSVETGIWATQRHNEEILDQAFRTSKEVYLIFGANKSGEFYGYARMAGPVRRDQQRVSWASRSPQSSASRSSQSSLAGRGKNETYFPPSDLRLVDDSPLPEDAATLETEGTSRHSAPAMLGKAYDLHQVNPVKKFSLDQGVQQKAFHLDHDATQRAMRRQEVSPNVKPQVRSGRSGPSLQSVDEVEEKEMKAEEVGLQPDGQKGTDTWGDSFAVEWLSTIRLPFHRTRDLRNPWNHDREIKVSRDGTELESTVGERLLEEWEKFAEELRVGSSSIG